MLSTSHEVLAASYTSLWTLRGISAMCDFMAEVMKRNSRTAFTDMHLTSHYYAKASGDPHVTVGGTPVDVRTDTSNMRRDRQVYQRNRERLGE